jgi:predicted nucleotidyltransferase
MRPTHTIDEILGSRSRIAVLRVLRGVGVPLNASQIAARTKLTRPAVASVLTDFADMGIVQSSSAGRANVHTLIRSSALVTELLEPLFAAEEQQPELLLEELKESFGDLAESVVLFGSYARGDQDPQSDIDVVLVARDPSAKELLERAAEAQHLEFHNRFGTTLSPLIYESREAAALHSRAPALFESVSKDGIVVSGTRPEQWGSDGQGQ